METWYYDFQDGPEENVFKTCRMVAEGGGTEPRHKQVSFRIELAFSIQIDIGRWELENKHSQAACWLVFTGQSHRAVKVLMNSKGK